MQLAIHIVREKCVGCYSCVVACKLEHNLPPHPVRPPKGDPKGPELIRVVEVGPQIHDDQVHHYFQPILCLHCLEAPCIEACPNSAIYRDPETGIILVKEDECSSCESCLEVCPHNAPYFLMENYIYAICASIDLRSGDGRGDTLLVKLPVQLEPYM